MVGSNDNTDRFAVFCSFHRLIIVGTMFESKTSQKANWVSTDRQRTSNQINYIAVCSR